MAEECVELKNIKYKTMLLSGNPVKETKSSNDLQHLDKFLENEMTNNKAEPWSKLDKTVKTKKLLAFAETYRKEKELSEEEEKLLVVFLKDCLDKKRIYRVKDVLYDKETGFIKDIPALTFNKTSKHFTLKNVDKRVSTQKSLAPKKTGTARHKTVKETVSGTSAIDSDEDNT
jgi:hypothetical protein